jgi:hypothetical protein
VNGQRSHRVSGIVLNALSLTALITVLVGSIRPPQSPPPDEGALARIFQLSVVAFVPTLFLFLATADWTRPGRNVRALALPAVALTLAFALLYAMEHRG